MGVATRRTQRVRKPVCALGGGRRAGATGIVVPRQFTSPYNTKSVEIRYFQSWYLSEVRSPSERTGAFILFLFDLHSREVAEGRIWSLRAVNKAGVG